MHNYIKRGVGLPVEFGVICDIIAINLLIHVWYFGCNHLVFEYYLSVD